MKIEKYIKDKRYLKQFKKIKRTLIRQIKKHSVALLKWSKKYDYTCRDIACSIGINPRTLKSWKLLWKQNHLCSEPVGRKPFLPTVQLLDSVKAFLNLTGMETGISVIKRVFPQIPLINIKWFLEDYRKEFYRNKKHYCKSLVWNKANTVWAADFTEMKKKVEGIYKYVLVFRDLCTGKILLTLPCKSQNADIVIKALKYLFYHHGIPLVLKSDNGSAFIAEEVRKYLDDNNVTQLLSPPYTPKYNGSIEAGMGSIKTRLFYISSRKDRPGIYTCDDLEEARLQSNELSRPNGVNKPTPDIMWYNKNDISSETRRTFMREVEICREEAMCENGLKYTFLNENQRRFINRTAITKALVNLNFLCFKKRRITPPFKSKKRTLIM